MSLTANIGSSYAEKFGSIQEYTVGASSGTIYRGATVAIATLIDHTDEGKVYPLADPAADATNKFLVVGIAQEKKAAGEKIRVRQDGRIKRKLSNATAAMVGKLACAKDDEEVQLYTNSTTKVIVGRIVEYISSSYVFVDFTDRPNRIAADAND